MTATPKQVADVQAVLGCEEESGDLEFQANPSYCAEHVGGHGDHVLWTDRGCPVAVAAADAATNDHGQPPAAPTAGRFTDGEDTTSEGGTVHMWRFGDSGLTFQGTEDLPASPVVAAEDTTPAEDTQ